MVKQSFFSLSGQYGRHVNKAHDSILQLRLHIIKILKHRSIGDIPRVTLLRSQQGLNRHKMEQDSLTKMHDLNIRVNSHIGLAFVFIFSYLILVKGDCGRNGCER